MDDKQTIVGIDEAGRGPLAGPVYVGAVALSAGCNLSQFSDLDDSKQMTETNRERLFDRIKNEEIAGLQTAVAYTKVSTIDRVGINPAIQRAINRVLRSLACDIQKTEVLLDGGLRAPDKYQQTTVKRGDQKHKEISLASVLAKVTRDRYMKSIDEQYGFDFAQHKGYGTKGHRDKIENYGATDIHRETYLTSI